jgi:hypothetical protein
MRLLNTSKYVAGPWPIRHAGIVLCVRFRETMGSWDPVFLDGLEQQGFHVMVLDYRVLGWLGHPGVHFARKMRFQPEAPARPNWRYPWVLTNKSKPPKKTLQTAWARWAERKSCLAPSQPHRVWSRRFRSCQRGGNWSWSPYPTNLFR